MVKYRSILLVSIEGSSRLERLVGVRAFYFFGSDGLIDSSLLARCGPIYLSFL